MNVNETLLLIALAAPFACAVLVAAGRRNPGWYQTVVTGAPFIVLVSVVPLLSRFSAGEQEARLLLAEIAPGLTLGFKVEMLGLIFAMVVAVLWPISMLYSMAYCHLNSLERQVRFYACFSLAVGGALGVAFAGDLLTLWVFYEVLTFSTYPLVAHYADAKSRAGARVYLTFLLGSSVLLFLPAIVWIYLACGTLEFAPGGILDGCVGHDDAGWLLLLLVFGSAKAALMPLHRWLPEAMVAPAPVSALLHAVAVVKAGVFTIAKVAVYIFGFGFMGEITSGWLAYVAGASVVIASLIALRQDSLKKRLAYSTVSQLSYITLGVALFKPAFFGAVLHLVAHAFGKITLFFAAGAIQSVSGKKRVSELRGLAYSMPWTMACFTIAALSMVGLPPLAGFASKWFLLEGAFGAEHYFAVGVLVLSTVLNVGYFAPVVYAAYVRDGDASRKASEEEPGEIPGELASDVVGETAGEESEVTPEATSSQAPREAPAAMVIAMVLPAVAVLLLFFYAGALVRLIEGIG